MFCRECHDRKGEAPPTRARAALIYRKRRVANMTIEAGAERQRASAVARIGSSRARAYGQSVAPPVHLWAAEAPNPSREQERILEREREQVANAGAAAAHREPGRALEQRLIGRCATAPVVTELADAALGPLERAAISSR